MSKKEKMEELAGRLDKVTNNIGQDYRQLLDAAADNVTDEQLARHEANIAILEQLGASVDNPVPDPGTDTGTDTGTDDGQPVG